MTEEELLEKNICGCGTVKDAVDTALREALKQDAGEDCMGWHMVINALIVAMSQNIGLLLAANKLGGDFEKAEEKLTEIVTENEELTRAIMSICNNYIKDALFDGVVSNRKTMKGTHDIHESVQ